MCATTTGDARIGDWSSRYPSVSLPSKRPTVCPTSNGEISLFAFLFAWLFGREFADRTVRDLVASPTSRSAIVIAKVAVGSAWSMAIIGWMLALALAIGFAIDAL